MERTAMRAKAARRVAARAVAIAIGVSLALATAAHADPRDLNQVSPQYDAYASQRPDAPPPWDRAAELVLSLGSTLINVVYFPVKLATGIVGAEVGGIAGAMTGGDVEAAAGVWNVTTDGSYFATPQTLDNRADFRVGGDQR
jgi:hypothetical protein